MVKRISALVLCLVLLFSVLPCPVFASRSQTVSVGTEDEFWDALDEAYNADSTTAVIRLTASFSTNNLTKTNDTKHENLAYSNWPKAILPEGVTLDLAGKLLTIRAIMTDMGSVTDSVGGGGLVLTPSNLNFAPMENAFAICENLERNCGKNYAVQINSTASSIGPGREYGFPEGLPVNFTNAQAIGDGAVCIFPPSATVTVKKSLNVGDGALLIFDCASAADLSRAGTEYASALRLKNDLTCSAGDFIHPADLDGHTLTVGGKRYAFDRKELVFTGAGQTEKLTFSDAGCTWSSLNSKVATVAKDGTVTPTGKGTTYVCAEAGGIVFACRVTVRAMLKSVSSESAFWETYDAICAGTETADGIRLEQNVNATRYDSKDSTTYHNACPHVPYYNVKSDGKMNIYPIVRMPQGKVIDLNGHTLSIRGLHGLDQSGRDYSCDLTHAGEIIDSSGNKTGILNVYGWGSTRFITNTIKVLSAYPELNKRFTVTSTCSATASTDLVIPENTTLTFNNANVYLSGKSFTFMPGAGYVCKSEDTTPDDGLGVGIKTSGPVVFRYNSLEDYVPQNSSYAGAVCEIVGTVKLTGDVLRPDETFRFGPGGVLDLNGHRFVCRTLNAEDGAVMDSATAQQAGAAGAVVAETLILSKVNLSYLPLKDGSESGKTVWRFYKVSENIRRQPGTEKDAAVLRLAFRFSFADPAAYRLIAGGKTGLEYYVTLRWDNNSLPLRFSDELLLEYAERRANGNSAVLYADLSRWENLRDTVVTTDAFLAGGTAEYHTRTAEKEQAFYTPPVGGIAPEKLQKTLVQSGLVYLNLGEYAQYDNSTISSGEGEKSRHAAYRFPENAAFDHPIYTVCTDYCNKIYYDTFGYTFHGLDENGAPTNYWTQALTRVPLDYSLCIAKYDVTDKKLSDRAAFIRALSPENLQVGDVFVYFNITAADPTDSDTGAGHAMFYAGDYLNNGSLYYFDSSSSTGTSAASGPRITLNTGKGAQDGVDSWESQGTCHPKPLNWASQAASTSHDRMVLLRPLNFLKNSTPTLSSLSRLQYPALTAERRLDRPMEHDVMPGETLRVSLILRNNGTEDYHALPVTEQIADGMQLVEKPSGAFSSDGNSLSWLVDLAVGKTKELSYTVRIDADAELGSCLVFPAGTVAQIPTREIRIAVGGKALTQAQFDACRAGKVPLPAVTGGKQLAAVKELYENLFGVTLPLPDTAADLVSQLTNYASSRFSLKRLIDLRTDQTAPYGMLVPDAFGGRASHAEHRFMEYRELYFRPGDIVIGTGTGNSKSTSTGSEVYVCLGGGKVAHFSAAGSRIAPFDNSGKSVYDGTVAKIMKHQNILVLRPSLVYEDLMRGRG